MKRFRNVSAIVSLLAGFITAVVMFINKYDLLAFIWILAVVMAVFYIVSRIICFICDRHITKEEEKAEEERLEKEKQEIEARINWEEAGYGKDTWQVMTVKSGNN